MRTPRSLMSNAPGSRCLASPPRHDAALKKLQIIVYIRTTTRMLPMEIASALGYRSADVNQGLGEGEDLDRPVHMPLSFTYLTRGRVEKNR
jgi:hypothetical protein